MQVQNSTFLTRDSRYIEVNTPSGHKGTIQFTSDGFLAYANTTQRGTWYQADFDHLRQAVEFIQECGVAL